MSESNSHPTLLELQLIRTDHQTAAVEHRQISKPLTLTQKFARSVVIKRLKQIQGDDLQLEDGDSTSSCSTCNSLHQPIRIQVHNPRFYQRLLKGGSLGAAESLMDGDWACSDLPRLVRLMIANQSTLDQIDSGWSWSRRALERLKHWLRRNTVSSSKQNIREHYDLGNEFFNLFLDPTLNYSSAVFETLEPQEFPESLHRAQLRKMRVLCESLQLSSQDHLLEIGSGWGALACFAAKHYGCKVTTTTISREQFLWAKERVRIEGLEKTVTVIEQDYRHLEGKFDKIVSVEMIEAVGDQFYDTFFQQCRHLLKPDGLLLLQAITIIDQRYEKHLKSVDFISQYIFPGGSLPCVSRLVESAAKSSEMRVVQLNDYAAHYAETLRRWRSRFWSQIDSIRGLGYSERFIRMWDYYLAYCEAAFDQRQINLVHLLFAQRSCRFDLTAAKASNRLEHDSINDHQSV